MKLFSAEATAALQSGDVMSVGAVKLATDTPVRVWGGFGTITLDGEVYEGIGDRGLVEVAGGSLGAAADGAQLTLSQVDPYIAATVDLAALRGVPVILWRLLFNGAGSRLLHPAVFLRGSVDKATRDDTIGGKGSIVVMVEGPARGLGRRSERMRSNADQQLIKPGDTGFSRVSYAGTKTIYWGGQPPARAGSAFGGSGPGTNPSIDTTLGRPFTREVI